MVTLHEVITFLVSMQLSISSLQTHNVTSCGRIRHLSRKHIRVTLHEVIMCWVSMQISISSMQSYNVNRCGRSRQLERKLSLRRKRSSPKVFEMAATEFFFKIIGTHLILLSFPTGSPPE